MRGQKRNDYSRRNGVHDPIICGVFGGQTSRAATSDVDETDLGLDENAFDEMDMLTEEQAGLSFGRSYPIYETETFRDCLTIV